MRRNCFYGFTLYIRLCNIESQAGLFKFRDEAGFSIFTEIKSVGIATRRYIYEYHPASYVIQAQFRIILDTQSRLYIVVERHDTDA